MALLAVATRGRRWLEDALKLALGSNQLGLATKGLCYVPSAESCPAKWVFSRIYALIPVSLAVLDLRPGKSPSTVMSCPLRLLLLASMVFGVGMYAV